MGGIDVLLVICIFTWEGILIRPVAYQFWDSFHDLWGSMFTEPL